MASAEAAAAAKTIVLRVSIHCQGCKKKVRKVLNGVEGVHKVMVDGAQQKVTVTGVVDADTLIRRLYKSGKKAVPWQPPAAEAKKPEAAVAVAALVEQALPAGCDGGKDADAAKEVKAEGSEKTPEEGTGSDKKPEQEKGAEKKAEQEEAKASDEGKKDGGESKAAEPDAKAPEGSEAAKEAAASAAKEQGNDEEEAKKDKPKDAEVVERSLPLPVQAAEPPVSLAQWAVHAHGGYSSYVAQPVLSYNVAQPSASMSYYAPRPEMAVSVHQQKSMAQPPWDPAYAYSPYPPMAPAPEFYYDHYAPPGMRSSPPRQDSYHLFDDENPNSCSLM